MGLLIDLSTWSGDLPTIDWTPGKLQRDLLTFSASAFQDKTEYLRSAQTEPISPSAPMSF